MKSVGIVGGGAGGIFAALGAARAAQEVGEAIDVRLFERNPRIGIKILISGGGKCNITHSGKVEDVLREGFPHINERRFLKSPMYRFQNADVLALLERHGVKWHSRENGRIFPDSGRAEDVLVALETELREAGVQIRVGSRIESAERSDNGWRLTANGKTFEPDALILATGGTSYSKTGTTGDGISFAKRLGHTIIRLRPALAPIYLKQPPPQELVGIALRDVILQISVADKLEASCEGDALITHRGLSGPATLAISREAVLLKERSSIHAEANLLGTSEDEARELVTELQRSRQVQLVKTWLEEILPNRFVPYVLAQSEISIERKWGELTRAERGRLLVKLVRYDFGEISEIPMERGEVTAGGVSLKEVNPKTMMSRRVAGLFFAGEMLDIAGEIGGYNLQAAYSTGWVAGEEAVRYHTAEK